MEGYGSWACNSVWAGKEHHGYIDVDSTPGKGTTFKIYLPLIESEVAQAKAEVQTITLKSCAGTILLAEDEPEIRDLVKISIRKDVVIK